MNRRRRTSNSTTLMIFLEEKKKKKKKKTQNYSAAEGVHVFGKRSWSKASLSVVVVVIIVNEREFFQRSWVYSWKCTCEREKGGTREHFFLAISNFFFFSSSHPCIKNGTHTHDECKRR